MPPVANINSFDRFDYMIIDRFDYMVIGNERSCRVSSFYILLTMNGRDSVFAQ